VSVRITEGYMSRRLLGDLQRSAARVAEAQGQVASGRRISKPSDDPLGTHRVLRLKAEAAEAARHKATVDEARGWVDVTDDALGTIGDAVQRVRELMVRAGTGTMQGAERVAIATEIEQLIGQVKLAANARYGDSYVFAGHNITGAPYTPSTTPGTDALAGDGEPIMRSIGPGVSVQINVTAASVLGDGSPDCKLLHTLRDVVAHLRADDADSVRTTDLRAIDRNLDELLSARTTAGALANRLDAAGARLGDIVASADRIASETRDVDMATAILDLSTQQSIYQAALRSGASIIQPSLMDFLR
jgi:flagellar hook-associated protein 3 FlgL